MLESTLNRTKERLSKAGNFKAKRATITSQEEDPMEEEESEQIGLSPFSFLQTAATMELLGLIATSKLIFTQPRGGGGRHLEGFGFLRTAHGLIRTLLLGCVDTDILYSFQYILLTTFLIDTNDDELVS